MSRYRPPRSAGTALITPEGEARMRAVVSLSDKLLGGIQWLHAGDYPADPRELNLSVITAMGHRYRVPVGLSDHTAESYHAPVLAVAAGATVIDVGINRQRRPDGKSKLVGDVNFAEAVKISEARDLQLAHKVMEEAELAAAEAIKQQTEATKALAQKFAARHLWPHKP